jgi:hypothetical protein
LALVEDNLLGEVGETLFHYKTLSAGIEHILPSMTLRMSPFPQCAIRGRRSDGRSPEPGS